MMFSTTDPLTAKAGIFEPNEGCWAHHVSQDVAEAALKQIHTMAGEPDASTCDSSMFLGVVRLLSTLGQEPTFSVALGLKEEGDSVKESSLLDAESKGMMTPLREMFQPRRESERRNTISCNVHINVMEAIVERLALLSQQLSTKPQDQCSAHMKQNVLLDYMLCTALLKGSRLLSFGDHDDDDDDELAASEYGIFDHPGWVDDFLHIIDQHHATLVATFDQITHLTILEAVRNAMIMYSGGGPYPWYGYGAQTSVRVYQAMCRAVNTYAMESDQFQLGSSNTVLSMIRCTMSFNKKAIRQLWLHPQVQLAWAFQKITGTQHDEKDTVVIQAGSQYEGCSLASHLVRLVYQHQQDPVELNRDADIRKFVEVPPQANDLAERCSACLLCGMREMLDTEEKRRTWSCWNRCQGCGYYHRHHALTTDITEAQPREATTVQKASGSGKFFADYFSFLLPTLGKKSDHSHCQCLIPDAIEFILDATATWDHNDPITWNALMLAVQCLDFLTEGSATTNSKFLLDTWSSTVIQGIMKFVKLDRPSACTVEKWDTLFKSSFRILGNFALGDDEMTQQVLDYGLLDMYRPLMRHPDDAIRSEACWSLSNILAGTAEQVNMALQASLLAEVMTVMGTDRDPKARRESLWCWANVLNSPDPEHISYAVSVGAFAVVGASFRALSSPGNLASSSGVKALNELMATLTSVLQLDEAYRAFFVETAVDAIVLLHEASLSDWASAQLHEDIQHLMDTLDLEFQDNVQGMKSSSHFVRVKDEWSM